MNSPVIRNCPVCGQEMNLVSRNSGGVNCDSCGFNAVSREVTDADYLANFRPLPDIQVVARNISERSSLSYWKLGLAD